MSQCLVLGGCSAEDAAAWERSMVESSSPMGLPEVNV